MELYLSQLLERVDAPAKTAGAFLLRCKNVIFPLQSDLSGIIIQVICRIKVLDVIYFQKGWIAVEF